MSLGARPKVRDAELVVERIGGEVLVYDRRRDKGHYLDETSALVFDTCDGTRDARELAAHLSVRTGRTIDEHAVAHALARLSEEGLLEERFEPRSHGRDWSRRQMLVRAGAVGAAAGVGFPVVRSIVAPTPAQAQSACLQVGESCGALDPSNPSAGCLQTGPQCCQDLVCTSPGQVGPCICSPIGNQ